jgi:hypothetical protein
MTKGIRKGLPSGIVLMITVVTFSVATSVAASTGVPGGDVSGTWTVSGSPYLINGDATVPAGQTLIIEPGVEVMSQSWHKSAVHGTLQALGTGSEPILFTAADKWLGICFIDLSQGRVHFLQETGRKQEALSLVQAHLGARERG